MTPRINDKALHRLTIPELSGGVNYRDGISQVLDNQLTDCNNVWYKNGLLKTRPAIAALNDNPYVHDYYGNEENVKVYAKKENFRVVGGETYFLVAEQSSLGIRFTYYPEDKTAQPIEVAYIYSSELPKGVDYTCNIFQHDADIYCFCSGYYEGEATPYYIYKIVDKGEFDFDEPLRITDELSEDEGGFYVPTVMINCLPKNPEEGWSYENEGTLLEGYNLFGNKYKTVYSTARQYEFPNDDGEATKDKMQYVLLSTTRNSFSGQTVTAEITYPSGKKIHHSVTLTGEYEWVQEAEAAEDGLIMEVLGVAIQFIDSNTSKVAEVSRSDFVRNNMVITAPCPTSKENYEKVLNMTRSEWFGGGSEGIYDGIHLFMGGNTKESEKALVCWSDFDKPLYFSENGYAYVGDKAQRVTAFGKQGESLIILKERETYATQYSGSDSVIDAEAVINQSVVDVTASEVTFPMVQVHGFVGCDCPNTVQLCRNRLVWAHSDGKVYTLVSANQYSERSVFEVSAMVQRKLTEEGAKNMRSALSADWEGHYILSLGNRFYLMDYNSYGYANVTSYSKNEDAQLHIPWWIWEKPTYNHNINTIDVGITCEEKPINVISMITVGDKLYLWTELEVSKGPAEHMPTYRVPELLVFEGEDDMIPNISFDSDPETTAQYYYRRIDSKEIPAMVQTKLFDFGGATIQKSVPKAEISFGNNEGVPITVTTITDRGETSREVVLDFEETDHRNPQFFKNVVIRNGERLNNRIGYRLESNGNLFVDALSVYYKLLGGSK